MRKFLALGTLAALALSACVKVDYSLGEGLIDKSLLYDIYTSEFPLTDIQLKRAEDLSGYSTSRLTVGAIRDAQLGLTTREAAFVMIPLADTVDLGVNPRLADENWFTLRFSADSISCNDDSQARIFQNIRATAVTGAMPKAGNSGCTQEVPHGTTSITEGVTVYDGSGELTFSFTKAYAQEYLDAVLAMKKAKASAQEPDSTVFCISGDTDGNKSRYEEWVSRIPGIHLKADAPEGNGGRINMFHFSCLSVSSNYYVTNNNVGRLRIHSTWQGVEKDSTFLFIPGEPEFVDESDGLENNTGFTQYCFNRTTHTQPEVLTPGATLLVEGGGGIKPVIPAQELQRKTVQAIADALQVTPAQVDTGKVIVVKASIILPFDLPADYRDMKYFPAILSPTVRTTATLDNEDGTQTSYYVFGGLTDASVSSENQGDVDRSNLQYAPDITYHLQELLTRKDLSTKTDADIWMLTIYTEKVANASGSVYDSSYYQQLLYNSYYSSLYGGYGGYGGYGSYGYGGYGYDSYGYSNYYSYMMLAQMMAASSEQSYSYTAELDKDRFYCAKLHGPSAADADRRPRFRVTFACPRD